MYERWVNLAKGRERASRGKGQHEEDREREADRQTRQRDKERQREEETKDEHQLALLTASHGHLPQLTHHETQPIALLIVHSLTLTWNISQYHT